MFGIRYAKVSPTTYLIQYRNGQPIREGTTVYIANAQQRIADLLNGTGKCTVFRTR